MNVFKGRQRAEWGISENLSLHKLCLNADKRTANYNHRGLAGL